MASAAEKRTIIQIVNGYEYDDTDIFMRWKIECSIQRGEVE